MPATYDANHLRSRVRLRHAEFDPDSADPVLVTLNPGASEACIALAGGARRFLASLLRTVGTGNTDAFQIIAATDASGSNPTVVVAHATPTGQNAINDVLVLECDVEQIREVLPAATHVGVRVELATATDEAVVAFLEADNQFERSGLTADYIA